jgi:6-phosphofructokinase 1
MGRHAGYLALGAAYGQPDIVLIPEARLNIDRLVERVIDIYELQKNVVILCAEGITDENGQELGAETASTDPAGNKVLSGAAESLRQILIQKLGDSYFTSKRRNESARAAIFTRKVGHTQRGGRPIQFDRYHAAQLGGAAVELLLEGRVNDVAVLQWNRDRGFHVDHVPSNDFRDRWGQIHARQVHPSFYDPEALQLSQTGIDYLVPIFANALGLEDLEETRNSLFSTANLIRRYHSVNVDINKRIQFIPPSTEECVSDCETEHLPISGA